MNILIYIAIFLAKMTEVSIGVFRLLLMTKGFRKQAALIVFFEQMIWVVNVSLVVTTNERLEWIWLLLKHLAIHYLWL